MPAPAPALYLASIDETVWTDCSLGCSKAGCHAGLISRAFPMAGADVFHFSNCDFAGAAAASAAAASSSASSAASAASNCGGSTASAAASAGGGGGSAAAASAGESDAKDSRSHCQVVVIVPLAGKLSGLSSSGYPQMTSSLSSYQFVKPIPYQLDISVILMSAASFFVSLLC